MHPYLLLGLRIFISIYSMIFMGLSIYAYDASKVWLMHITTWNYLLSTVYFILVICIAAKELLKEQRRTSYSVISISPHEHEDGELSTPAQRAGNIPIIMIDGKELLFNYDSDVINSSDDEGDEEEFVDIDDDEMSVGYQLPFFYRITYCIFNVSGNLSVVITIAYWSMLHNYDIPIYLNLTSFIQIDASVIVLFWYLLEVVFNDIPIHILHFVYPVVLTGVYFIVYATYTACTGHVIYKNIDFLKEPLHGGIIVVILLLGIVLVQVFLFALERSKRHLANKMNKLRKESFIRND